MTKYTPIYEKDGHEFIVPSSDQVGADRWEAEKIGWGTQLVEGVILAFKPTGRFLELDDEGMAQVTGQWAKLGGWDIIILEEAADAKPA